jgi:hypothetical protein
MITPFLEKLILSGNASFNTFVVGGSEKHILNVDSNRFIIITDLIYFHQVNNDNFQKNFFYRYNNQDILDLLTRRSLTQCRIISDKSSNHFIFRNNYSFSNDGNQHTLVTPLGSTKIDVYLIHESDVSFTFSRGNQLQNESIGQTPANSVGYPNPTDYNKQGNYGNVDSIRLKSNVNPTFDFVVKQGGKLIPDTPNLPNSLQLEFPVNTLTRIDDLEYSLSYPLMLVNYVEIQGNPTNISATL